MSLLPIEERRDEIKFKFFKTMPYNNRMACIVAALVAGVGIQLFFLLLRPDEQFSLLHLPLGVWFGLPFLALGSLMSLVKGYDNVPKRKRARSREWQRATREKFAQVLEMDRKSRQWDRTAIDVSCVPGFLLFAVVVVAAFGGGWLARRAGYHYYGSMWTADVIVLLVPHWIVGIRSILKNTALIIKIKQSFPLMALHEKARQEGEELECWLEVLETADGSYPVDAKLMLKFHKASADFLGMQTQVAINNVQGTDYPYLYCVIIAKPEFNLLAHAKMKVGGLTVEPKREGEVDIIVIRQRTTRTSGYHTNAAAARGVFLKSLAAARRLAGSERAQLSSVEK